MAVRKIFVVEYAPTRYEILIMRNELSAMAIWHALNKIGIKCYIKKCDRYMEE